jgi:hypothetical protein
MLVYSIGYWTFLLGAVEYPAEFGPAALVWQLGIASSVDASAGKCSKSNVVQVLTCSP